MKKPYRDIYLRAPQRCPFALRSGFAALCSRDLGARFALTHVRKNFVKSLKDIK